MTWPARCSILAGMKKCFRCFRVLPISCFYVHPRMADGHLGKCKECNKKDVRENYAKRRKKYSEYDRMRFKNPERKLAVAGYQRKMRELYPDKFAARTAVGNAIRDGRLVRGPCRVCGSRKKIQAHHTDYSKPLDVVWLCFRHHREIGHGQVVSI